MPPASRSAVVETAVLATAALDLDRVLCLQIDPRGNHLVTAKVAPVAVAAYVRVGGRNAGDGYADQRCGCDYFEHSVILLRRNTAPAQGMREEAVRVQKNL